MIRFDDAPKRATNLTLNAKVLDTAKQLGMNVSATVDKLLMEAVTKAYWERWNEDNKDAIADYNARIEREDPMGAGTSGTAAPAGVRTGSVKSGTFRSCRPLLM